MFKLGLAFAVSLGGMGCGLPPVGSHLDGGCSAARVRSDASCCPPWTYSQGGSCALRAWGTPLTLDDQAVEPATVVTPSGEVVVAWLRPAAPLVLSVIAAHEGEGFALRSPTAPLIGSTSELHVATGGEGSVALVWRRASDGQTFIEASARTADGRWRDEPLPLSFPPDGGEPDVAVGDDGEILVAWNQWTGSNYGVAVARRPAGREVFERPDHPFDVVSPLVQFSNDPEIVINTQGDAIISWYQSLGDELVTLISERDGRTGTFSKASLGTSLSPAGDPVEDPVVDIADDGRAVVAWRQEVGSRAAVFLAERDEDGVWTTPASAAETFSSAVDEVWNVRVALAADGSLYVAWESHDGSDVAVMVAHRDASGRWLASGRDPVRLSSSSARAIEPVLALGDDGHVVAAWTELTQPEWRVVARRTATGGDVSAEETRWSPPEQLSVSGDGAASDVDLAVGGSHDRVAATFVQGGRLQLSTVD